MMKRRGKPDGSGARSVLGCLLVPVAYIVAPAAAYFLTYHAMERVVLTTLYGEARYAAGLRMGRRSPERAGSSSFWRPF
jgi:hypothetical protein